MVEVNVESSQHQQSSDETPNEEWQKTLSSSGDFVVLCARLVVDVDRFLGGGVLPRRVCGVASGVGDAHVGASPEFFLRPAAHGARSVGTIAPVISRDVPAKGCR